MQRTPEHDHHAIEEGVELSLDFDKLKKVAATGEPLIVAIAQNIDTGEILIAGFANREAVERSLQQRLAIFYSTSRRELWIKGATSGDYLDLVEARVNCEQNSILYMVRARNHSACHTRGSDGNYRSSCYYRTVESDGLHFRDGMR